MSTETASALSHSFVPRLITVNHSGGEITLDLSDSDRESSKTLLEPDSGEEDAAIENALGDPKEEPLETHEESSVPERPPKKPRRDMTNPPIVRIPLYCSDSNSERSEDSDNSEDVENQRINHTSYKNVSLSLLESRYQVLHLTCLDQYWDGYTEFVLASPQHCLGPIVNCTHVRKGSKVLVLSDEDDSYVGKIGTVGSIERADGMLTVKVDLGNEWHVPISKCSLNLSQPTALPPGTGASADPPSLDADALERGNPWEYLFNYAYFLNDKMIKEIPGYLTTSRVIQNLASHARRFGEDLSPLKADLGSSLVIVGHYLCEKRGPNFTLRVTLTYDNAAIKCLCDGTPLPPLQQKMIYKFPVTDLPGASSIQTRRQTREYATNAVINEEAKDEDTEDPTSMLAGAPEWLKDATNNTWKCNQIDVIVCNVRASVEFYRTERLPKDLCKEFQASCASTHR